MADEPTVMPLIDHEGQQTEKDIESLKPICPFCKDDPLTPFARIFATRKYNVGPFQLLLVFCSKCRAILPAAVLGVVEPEQRIQRPPVRLV